MLHAIKQMLICLLVTEQRLIIFGFGRVGNEMFANRRQLIPFGFKVEAFLKLNLSELRIMSIILINLLIFENSLHME
jgi:hypothetical protein